MTTLFTVPLATVPEGETMPITLAEVDEYKAGLTDEQKKDWLHIFNAAFAAYEVAGMANEEERKKRALLIATNRVDSDEQSRSDAISQKAWADIAESDYTIDQLVAAVPAACLTWAKAQAKAEKRDLTKADLKLRYKNPDGTVNINGIRAALSRLPQTKLPQDVLDKAKAELEKALTAAKKALGIKDRGDAQIRQSYGEARIVRYDEELGLLVADVPIAKMTVLPYLDSSGNVVHELKHPRDFATPAFLATVPGKPVVDGHAPNGVPFDELSEDDRARYTSGVLHTGQDSVWVEDSLVYAREVVFDEALIADIKEHKKVQVSTGIWAQIEDEEGTYDGMQYQRRQKHPMLDHLAHVPQGRCGADCSVVIDGAIEITETHDAGGSMAEKKDEKKQDEQQAVVRELKLDEAAITLCPDVKVEDAEAFQAAIDALVQAKADAEAATATLQAQLDAAKGEGDGKDEVIKTLQDELKTVQEAQTKLDTGLEGRLDERIDMIAFMQELDEEYDHHGKTVQDMRVDALKHFDETFDPKDLSEEYVRARFDTVRDFYEKQLKDPTGVFDLRAPRTDQSNEEDEAKTRADARTVGLYRDPLKQGKKE